MPRPSPIENDPLITLFTTPKPFAGPDDHTSMIQRNAIASWSRLPRARVVLVGDEPGIAQTASELGVGHASGLAYNEHGTPLVSSAFEIAHRCATTPLLAYCNSDVILFGDFVDALESVGQQLLDQPWVAFGRRIDLQVDVRLDLQTAGQENEFRQRAQQQGTICSQVCKEYFAFSRSLYTAIPPFAIGRGNWDNWMIWSAKKSGIPVVNISQYVTAIHQKHQYQHTGKSSRRNVYVSGTEAKNNQRLAAGCHWISGSVGSHRLTQAGVVAEKNLLINAHFWADVPRFLRLVAGLVRH